MHFSNGLPKRQNIAWYIQLIWLDLLFVTLACVLAYVISLGQPFRMHKRVFPMWFNDSTGLWEGELKYSYPHIPYVLGIFKSGLLIGTVPIGAVILMQIWVRNFLDLNAAIWGLLKALTLMILFQFILKQYIGGFRPYFLTLCNPDTRNLTRYLEGMRSSYTTTFNPSKYTTAGKMITYNRVFATPTDCQVIGDKSALIHAMQSFPSGHSGMAFAVGVFLSLYLNAKLKSFADYHTSFWKVLLVLLPLVGAMMVAGGLMIDKNHHPTDIIFGSILGAFLSLLAYRSHYTSIFSYRTNHIPLPYSSSLRSGDLPLHEVLEASAFHSPKRELKYKGFWRILNNWNEKGREVAVDWPKEKTQRGGGMGMGEGGGDEELRMDGGDGSRGRDV